MIPSSSALANNYVDIDHWPYRWRVEPRDLLPGERLLDIFKTFLDHLLNQGLARKTLLLHRDHVGTLGEEIIRRLNTKPQPRRRAMVPVMLVFLDEDGGPLIYPPASSPRQRAFDSTCSKLRRFLLDS